MVFHGVGWYIESLNPYSEHRLRQIYWYQDEIQLACYCMMSCLVIPSECKVVFILKYLLCHKKYVLQRDVKTFYISKPPFTAEIYLT